MLSTFRALGMERFGVTVSIPALLQGETEACIGEGTNSESLRADRSRGGLERRAAGSPAPRSLLLQGALSLGAGGVGLPGGVGADESAWKWPEVWASPQPSGEAGEQRGRGREERKWLVGGRGEVAKGPGDLGAGLYSAAPTCPGVSAVFVHLAGWALDEQRSGERSLPVLDCGSQLIRGVTVPPCVQGPSALEGVVL